MAEQIIELAHSSNLQYNKNLSIGEDKDIALSQNWYAIAFLQMSNHTCFSSLSVWPTWKYKNCKMQK